MKKISLASSVVGAALLGVASVGAHAAQNPFAVQELSSADLPIWQEMLSGQCSDNGEKPEVVIIGTGNRQAFLPPSVLAPFYQAGIGVECMTSGAAARSYNVLISEDRRVLALILLPTADN